MFFIYLSVYCFTLMLNDYQCETIARETPFADLIRDNFAKYEKDKSIGQLSRVNGQDFSGNLRKCPVVTNEHLINVIAYTQVNDKLGDFIYNVLLEGDQFRFGRLLEKPELCPNLNRTILTMKRQRYTDITSSQVETIYVKPDGCEEGAIIKRIHLKTNDSSALPIYVHGEIYPVFLFNIKKLVDSQIYVSIGEPNGTLSNGTYRVNEINVAFRPSHSFWFNKCRTLADIDSYWFGSVSPFVKTVFQEAQYVECFVDPKQFVHINKTDQPNVTYVYLESDQITIQTVSIINETETKSAPIPVIPTTFGLGRQFDITGKCQTDRRTFCDTMMQVVPNKTLSECYVLPDDCEHGAFYMKTNLNTNRNNLISDVPIYLQTNSIAHQTRWKRILDSDYLIVTIERNNIQNTSEPKVEKYFVHEIDVFSRFDPTQVTDIKTVDMETIRNWYHENGFDRFEANSFS